MDDIANRKASKEHGYYVAVTTLNSIGEGKVRELSGDVLFPVIFSCITQKPAKGEILVGTVDKILKQGVFLKSGPISSIFLSEKMMRDYKYVGGENPMFLNDKHAKLEKDTMVRFKVELKGLSWLLVGGERERSKSDNSSLCIVLQLRRYHATSASTECEAKALYLVDADVVRHDAHKDASPLVDKDVKRCQRRKRRESDKQKMY
ncbi:hypothetical protein B296_00013153 [Ensete ventricosum]|uniref:DNA-directed RNA polymerase subunit n=1 Tax=Ensete ventricosum TaxID=4639 RepID=A0A427B1Y7_ENSVE|nr:hypothetical protein B296_00013153 [Ensete ventricosum]